MELTDREKRIFRRHAVLFIMFMVLLAAVFFVLYCIVYERCYNVMNEDKLISLRFYKNGGDIFIVIFNNIYKLFSL